MSYILRTKEDVANTPLTNAHGGDGTILVRQMLGNIPGSDLPGFPGDLQTPVNFLHIVTLPPGSSIGYHEHPNNEEFYYLMEGQATLLCDENTLTMNAGDVFLVKKGSGHDYRNESEKDVVVMVVEMEYA